MEKEYHLTQFINAYSSKPFLFPFLALDDQLPLTFKLAELVTKPALFSALQVYFPMCLWPMLLITSIEIRLPISVIVIPCPDVKLWP